MRIAVTRDELAEALTGIPEHDIMFVPTMGALHEGHLSLVRAASKTESEVAEGVPDAPLGRKTVVVSIFVNPTQFNDPADLANYPRTPDRDLAMLRAEGVDVVFMPRVEDVYPEGNCLSVVSAGTQDVASAIARYRYDFGELDKVMEGATRPGHFDGVAQVVSRLFELVRPARAFFGQKDFQQVAIIREMVRQAQRTGESWAGVKIVECPIVREADGLAMSSRNELLSPEHRAAAPDIYRALKLGAEKAETSSEDELRQTVVAEVERSGVLKVIYFDFMGPRACIAVQAGNVRLIDNYDYRGTEI